MTALTIILFITMAAAMLCLGMAALAPVSNLGTRLRFLGGVAPRKASRVEQFEEKVLGPLSKAVPRSPDEVSRTRLLLMRAGYREARHLAWYFGLRVLLAAAMPLWFLVQGAMLAKLIPALAGLAKAGFHNPFILIALAMEGYMLPSFVLKRKIKRRQKTIQLSLPDALDLSVICTEAGLGLDQTILRVTNDLKYAHKELCDELNLVTLEMRAGKPRADAFHNLAERTGVEDLRALVAVLIQTDRFGTSVGQALRVHSDSLRTERRQRAEEQAAKTTIKMVPVLVFFVLPSMFIVTLGPAFIQMLRNLLPEIQK